VLRVIRPIKAFMMGAGVNQLKAKAETAALSGSPGAAPGRDDCAVDAGLSPVVVIDDLREMADYAAAWDDLAAAAIEPNPFYESWMLVPAIAPYTVGRDVRFVLFFATDEAHPQKPKVLCGLFPLEISNRYKGLSRKLPVRTLSLWKHKYCYLCTPLVRAGYEQQCLEAFLDWLARDGAGCQLMEFRSIGSEGSFHRALVDEFNRRGTLSFVSECFTRAMFRPARDPDDYIRKAISGDHKKSFRRLQRRLGEQGNLQYVSLGPDDDPRSWIEEFLKLEAISWKGKQARALVSQAADQAYFEEVAMEAFRRGRMMMMAARLDGRAIAHKCNFLAAPGSFAFKIAYDEEYARYSPGVLLEFENIRRLHQMPEIEWMDSCSNRGNSMINRIWTERLTIKDVVIGTGRGAGELWVSLMPFLKWLNRAVRRRDLLRKS
jgi:GNAT acetyltransferase-like protein